MPAKMNDDGLSIGGPSMGGLEAFVIDSNDALKFRFLRCSDDMKENEAGNENDDGRDFEPVMTHQIYGDNENIFGYRDLRLDVWMSASTLKAFVAMGYGEVVDKSKTGGVEPDPVVEPLMKLFAPGQVLNSKDEMRAHLASDKFAKFSPLGEKIDEFKVTGTSGDAEEVYEVFAADDSVTGFRDYHSKLQPWIMFYIDAASYIDIDDPNWRFFLVFEKYSCLEDGSTRYAIAGYATVYQYYAYPANIRPRISQVLVLPPFQRRGIGSRLLNTVYKQYLKNDKVIDITVEDPSDEFVRLRDFVDAKNCLAELSTMATLDSVSAGFTAEMAKEANEKLKLCRRQTRRVYEIIRLMWAKKAGGVADKNQHYTDFRINVKKRLNLPFKSEERKMEKLKRALKPEEFAAATLNITNREQRLESLHAQYKELEDHYLHIIDRISAY